MSTDSIASILNVCGVHVWKEYHNSNKSRYRLACPLPDHPDTEHRDGSGSFSISADGACYCFGCSWKGHISQLFEAITGHRDYAIRPAHVKQPKAAKKDRPRPTGTTVRALAFEKRLPEEYLRQELGWSDTDYYGIPAVKTPYYGMSGQVVANRFRVGLTGDRFRWEKDSQPEPYGLHKLSWIRQMGQVILVEGETDYATMDSMGYPVLGVPGAATFKKEWSYYLQGIKVFVWCEPDSGGWTLLNKLLDAGITATCIEGTHEAKDPNAMWVNTGQDKKKFQERFSQLVALAELAVPSVKISAKPLGKKPNVQNRERRNNGMSISQTSSRRGFKALLWKAACDHFRFPSGQRPLVRGAIGFDHKKQKAIGINLILETWRHPANAQWKRRKIFFHLLPKLNSQPVYTWSVPQDDCGDTEKASLKRKIKRHGGDAVYFLGGGMVHWLSSVPLQHWAEVGDTETTLVNMLNLIRPPTYDPNNLAEVRFCPYGGTDGWSIGLQRKVEEDQGSVEILAKADAKLDHQLIEADLQEASIRFEYTAPYYRAQVGNTLTMSFPDPIATISHFAGAVGFHLTQKARNYLAETLTV